MCFTLISITLVTTFASAAECKEGAKTCGVMDDWGIVQGLSLMQRGLTRSATGLAGAGEQQAVEAVSKKVEEVEVEAEEEAAQVSRLVEKATAKAREKGIPEDRLPELKALTEEAGSKALEAETSARRAKLAVHNAQSRFNTLKGVEAAGIGCAWRQTGQCSPDGPREPDRDKNCDMTITVDSSGFCDCNGDGEMGDGDLAYDCSKGPGTTGTCNEVCEREGPPSCAWRQTGNCDPEGVLEPHNDKPCDAPITHDWSGFCDCNGDAILDQGEPGYVCGEGPGTANAPGNCRDACGVR